MAKAVLERPWKGDIEFSRTFTVLGMLDLNADSDAKVCSSKNNKYEAAIDDIIGCHFEMADPRNGEKARLSCRVRRG